MGESVAYVGLFVCLGGLVGMVAPQLLRLQRREHALAIAAAGFFLFWLPELDQAAERERAAQAERAERRGAVEVERAAPSSPWNNVVGGLTPVEGARI